MIETIEEKLRLICSDNERQSNEQTQRKIISDILLYLDNKEEIPFEFGNGMNRSEVVSVCLNKLRILNNKSNSRKRSSKFFNLDLGTFLDEVCLSSNILLADKGIKIQFSSCPCNIVCSPTLIIDAFLNLISNAVKFSDGASIDVNFKSTENQTVINVTNYSDKIEPFDFSSGLHSASNICRIHGGRLLFSFCNNRLTASISINRHLVSDGAYNTPTFSHYLSDKYSPVYIGLSEVISYE